MECKLARNPEANRDVLAQLLNYAGGLASLNYETLSERVRRATRQMGDVIASAVLGKDAEFDERKMELAAGVNDSLRRGKLLLLVVADRLPPYTRDLVELLQERVLQGFTFAMVEMPIYTMVDGGRYLVLPRLVTKTETITRTVVLAKDVDGNELRVQKMEESAPAGQTELDFFKQLSRVNPAYPARVKAFLGKATDLGCETQLLRKYNVYVDDGLGGRLNVLSISSAGTIEIWGTASRDERLGEPVGRDYMVRVAALLPNGRLKDDLPSPGSWNVRVDDRVAIRSSLLLEHEAKYLALLTSLRSRLLDLQRRREGQES